MHIFCCCLVAHSLRMPEKSRLSQTSHSCTLCPWCFHWTVDIRQTSRHALLPAALMTHVCGEARKPQEWKKEKEKKKKKKQCNVPDSNALLLLALGWRQWDPMHLWRLSSKDWQWTQTGSLNHKQKLEGIALVWLVVGCALCSLKHDMTASEYTFLFCFLFSFSSSKFENIWKVAVSPLLFLRESSENGAHNEGQGNY